MEYGRKTTTKQKGFSLAEGLAILVVILVVGFGGYYVGTRNSGEDTHQSTDEHTAQQVKEHVEAPEQKSQELEDPTLDWTLFGSPKGDFSMRLPNGWDVVGVQGFSGFYARDFLDDREAPAAVEIKNVGGDYTGPYLFNVILYDREPNIHYQHISDRYSQVDGWGNPYGLNALLYKRTIAEDDPPNIGNPGDIQYIYLVGVPVEGQSDKTLEFRYLYDHTTQGIHDEIQRALTTVTHKDGPYTSPGDFQ